MQNTLIVVSGNLSMNRDAEKARITAEECVRLLLEKNSEKFNRAIHNNENSVSGLHISSCGGALAAALLESGLIQNKQARFISKKLTYAPGEENKTVYYGAVAWE
jgi:hypothetical protein